MPQEPYIGGVDEITGKQFHDLDENGTWLDEMSDARGGCDTEANNIRYRNYVDLWMWVYSMGQIFTTTQVYKSHVESRLFVLGVMIGPDMVYKAIDEAKRRVHAIYPEFEKDQEAIQDSMDRLEVLMSQVNMMVENQNVNED